MSTTEIVILIIVAIGVLTPVVVVLAARLAERRNPPIGQFLDIDGVRLHYVERGDAAAPAVVLFHGNGAMIQDLAGAELIELLARRYRVICFDRPGFGYSSRPRFPLMTPDAQAAVFDAALARLNVRNPLVFGHSWGALVALALALRAPQTRRPVKGLVLAAGYYFPTARLDVWMVSGPAIPIIGDIMCYTISPILGWLLSRKVIRTLFAPDEVPQAFKDEFPLSLALRPWQLRATAEESALMVPGAARLQARYRSLSCPIVIYAATGDTMVEAEQAPRLQRTITASVLHTVRDTGHMLHYAVPDEIVGTIDDMMASVRLVGSPRLAPSDERAAAIDRERAAQARRHAR
jgi:pimeloyl-ACP methyl ester carboxylesterase